MLRSNAKLGTEVLCVSRGNVTSALSVAGVDIVLSTPAAVRVDTASDHALDIQVSNQHIPTFQRRRLSND